MPVRYVVVLLVTFGVLLVACGDGGSAGEGAPDAKAASVVRVGTDRTHRTIQEGVDAARPGDLVLIDPGTYREAVRVDTDRLVIRGRDRNAVVLDGGDELLNGFEVSADRVAIENLTVQRFAVNGVLFAGSYAGDDAQPGPSGWRASYVTAANNGLYGLYAFGTGPGQFDHSYASGHPDSGIYVGQCRACGAVVIDNVAERNAVGYENTNASGVTVAGNVFRRNRVGVTMGSGSTERLAPQDGGSIVANLVTDNDDPATPETRGGFGVGIAIAGGQGNEIRGNVVTGHDGAGIVLVDQEGFAPTGNRITGNTLRDNALDLLFAATGTTVDAADTCFGDNGEVTTHPPDLQTVLACDEPAGTPVATPLGLPDGPPGVAVGAVPLPGDQPDRPGDDEVWTVPAPRPEALDLEAVAVPEPPA